MSTPDEKHALYLHLEYFGYSHKGLAGATYDCVPHGKISAHSDRRAAFRARAMTEPTHISIRTTFAHVMVLRVLPFSMLVRVATKSARVRPVHVELWASSGTCVSAVQFERCIRRSPSARVTLSSCIFQGFMHHPMRGSSQHCAVIPVATFPTTSATQPSYIPKSRALC